MPTGKCLPHLVHFYSSPTIPPDRRCLDYNCSVILSSLTGGRAPLRKPRIAFGTDHGGYPLATDLRAWFATLDIEIIDLGAHTFDPDDDYPDYAALVARTVANGDAEKGIAICGSGVGASMVANKIKGVRASVCHDIYSAHQGVEHDDMNVLCIGGRVIGIELAKSLVEAFLAAQYSGEERHQRRLKKIKMLDLTDLPRNPDPNPLLD